MDASIAYRWEMDLSPGSWIAPLMLDAGEICLCIGKFECSVRAQSCSRAYAAALCAALTAAPITPSSSLLAATSNT